MARPKRLELLTPRFVIGCAADDFHPGAADFSRRSVSFQHALKAPTPRGYIKVTSRFLAFPVFCE